MNRPALERGKLPVNHRGLLQFRLPTLLVAVTVLCVLLVANTRPSEPISLGHVSSDDPRIRPGLWIMGNEFGWPWTWRVESFKSELFDQTPFDRIDYGGLAANVAAGLMVTLSAVFAAELLLRRMTSRGRPNNRKGDSV
jgi:hypothetical protein